VGRAWATVCAKAWPSIRRIMNTTHTQARGWRQRVPPTQFACGWPGWKIGSQNESLHAKNSPPFVKAPLKLTPASAAARRSTQSTRRWVMVKWEKRAKLGSITVRKVAHTCMGLDTRKGSRSYMPTMSIRSMALLKRTTKVVNPRLGKATGARLRLGVRRDVFVTQRWHPATEDISYPGHGWFHRKQSRDASRYSEVVVGPHSFHPDPLGARSSGGAGGRRFRWLVLERFRARDWRLLRAHGGGHGWVSPIFLPSRLQHLAHIFSFCWPLALRVPHRMTSLVGQPPPLAPSTLGHTARPAFRQAARVLALAFGVDRQRHLEDRPPARARSRQILRATRLESAWNQLPAFGPARPGIPPHRRSARPGLGLHGVHRLALARFLRHQLPNPHVRRAPIRNQGQFKEPLAAGHPHHGRGWHNNHHHYPSAANQGFFWWEIDLTYAVLRMLKAVGLIWDLRRPPAHVLAGPLVGERKQVTLGRAA